MKRIFYALFLCMFMLVYTQAFAMKDYTFDVTLLVDTIPPKTENNYDSLWHNKDWAIDLNANDAHSGIKDTYYRVNSGQIFKVSESGKPIISSEGNNVLEYWSVDKVGNEEFPHKLLSDIRLDKTSPVVNITSPANESAFNDDRITVSGTVADNLSGVKDVTINAGEDDYAAMVDKDGKFSADNIKIVGGPNNVKVCALDMADNSGNDNISVFLGWVLHLKIPYCEINDYYSSTACSRMILNYMRKDISSELSQQDIYNYGHKYNDSKSISLLEMDARAMRYCLGHFDPYDLTDLSGAGDANRGYNFGIETFEKDKFTEYLRDIIHWMAYPVTIGYWRQNGELVAHPNTPAVVPAYGTYNHWVVINGAATTGNPIPEPHTNPWYTPDFTVYGLWLTDPASEGIGQDLYVTAQSSKETYLFPVISSDSYNGKYLQVAEPPEVESEAKVDMADAKVNKETLEILKISEELSKEISESLPDFEKRLESAKRHLYDAALVVNLKNDITYGITVHNDPLLESVFDADNNSCQELDWRKIVDSSLLTDGNFIKAFDGSQARSFVKVKRVDKGKEFYYLIPFDKYVNGQFLTYAAMIIDAQDGSFEEASWVEEPVRFIQVTKEKAIKLVISEETTLQNTALDAELIWQPGGFSQSPFYPYWKVFSTNGQIYFVTQKGEVIKEDEKEQ